ncbi:MAG: Alpha-xylosidase [Lentisphaerae bacterium ADurb.Bin242]|nr:MAG: Alpha-xylosidase [Lentisphaerae bacterium ADurb.Bin242]
MFQKDFSTLDRTEIRIAFPSERIARIQMVPAKREMEDSALNRYGFINDPGPVDFQFSDSLCRTSAMSVGVDEPTGKIRVFDGAGGILLDMKDYSFQKKGPAAATFKAIEMENWTGFSSGARDRLFHRGHPVNCRLVNIYSYIASPFCMSTAGYAVLVNSTHTVRFDLAKTHPDSWAWQDDRGVLDFYVFAAPTFREQIALYTELTGRPQMIPEWAFGFWYCCRDKVNCYELTEMAARFRNEKFPCDSLELEPGWMSRYYDFTTEKEWNRERFDFYDGQKPLPFIGNLKRLGFHFGLWLCNDYDLSFEEERRLGNRIQKDESQKFNEFFDIQDEHLTVPFRFDSITKVEEAWFEHLKKFVDQGADFFKMDASRQVLEHPDRHYGNGLNDDEMHNLYSLLYCRQMWEGYAEHTKRRPFVFNPCGWTGFQHWAATWAGDIGGGKNTLPGILGLSMLGHSLNTTDMESRTPEGIHYGYLLPLCQINGWCNNLMPWLLGGKLSKMHRDYGQLRSRLIPYLYSEFRQSTLDGQPLLSPLCLEFQNDLETRTVVYEYLLGHALLVTIYEKKVYFPAGRWHDFWTGRIFEGPGWRNIDWPEDRGGGLFLREGALLPMGPVMQYRGEIPLEDMELRLFPGPGKRTFGFYEDDGATFSFRNGEFELSPLVLEGGTLTLPASRKHPARNWRLRIVLDKAPARVSLDGLPLDFEWNPGRKEILTAPVASGTVRWE